MGVNKLNCRGQSLLEIIITIGLAAMVITALTIVAVKSLGASQTARLQAEASKYAQQGVDVVRGIRDGAGTLCIASSGTYTAIPWDGSFWGGSGNCTSSNTCDFKIVSTSGTGDCPVAHVPYLDTITGFEPIAGTVFSRQIIVTGTSSVCQRQVTSTVQWSDLAGAHQSQVVTILAEIPCP